MATDNSAKNDDDIDYTAEGLNPPQEKDDPTNEGYDEAAHSGPSQYGVLEGQGGVFGTSGGGTADTGFHVEERQIPYEGGGDDSGKSAGVRGEGAGGTGRDEE